MEKIVDATYDGEVVRFDEPVDLAKDTKVKVVIEEAPKPAATVPAAPMTGSPLDRIRAMGAAKKE